MNIDIDSPLFQSVSSIFVVLLWAIGLIWAIMLTLLPFFVWDIRKSLRKQTALLERLVNRH